MRHSCQPLRYRLLLARALTCLVLVALGNICVAAPSASDFTWPASNKGVKRFFATKPAATTDTAKDAAPAKSNSKSGKASASKKAVPDNIPDRELVAPAPVRVLKKKIVVAVFDVAKPAQLTDVDDIAHGFADQLTKRLADKDIFIVKPAPYTLPLQKASDQSDVQKIRQLASTHDSQYVITGEIRNAGIYTEKKLGGVVSTDRRNIEVDVILCDGESGTVIARHSLREQIVDKVTVGRDKAFGSANFYATAFGKATNAILEDASRMLAQDLEKAVVIAKVIKVNKNQVIIDIGGSSALAIGDQFDLFSQQSQLPALSLSASPSSQLSYGVPEKLLGHITISQVQPSFAVGDLSADSAVMEIQIGDIVRSGNIPASSK